MNKLLYSPMIEYRRNQEYISIGKHICEAIDNGYEINIKLNTVKENKHID
jgi:hypothetical protein